MKLKLIQFFLIIGLILGGAGVFYYYYPQIWGEVFYPLEYKDEILKASEENNLPRNFICAVIFTESHFNLNAKSSAGASGLMQLMPGTARGVAARIGMTDYTDAKIFDPAVNIRLGSAYIKAYYDLYNKNIDAILMAYNAGPAYSGRFVQDGNRNAIPRETDGFIRKVRASWEAYDRIYGSEWQGSMKSVQKTESETFIEKIDIFNLLDLLKK